MDKYSGLNKVDTVVKTNDEIVRNDGNEGKKGVGFFRLFLWQTVIAVLLGATLFVGKIWKNSVSERMTASVKAAVCFDMFGYVAEYFEEDV